MTIQNPANDSDLKPGALVPVTPGHKQQQRCERQETFLATYSDCGSILSVCALLLLHLLIATACGNTDLAPAGSTYYDGVYRMRREAMVRAYDFSPDKVIKISDARVLNAMATVPREEFVLPEDKERSYLEMPLYIGLGQTISQPYIVALMTQLLALELGDRALEIGTGSGYQAAVLAEVADQVYSVEIIPELADQASARFHRLGYGNISLKRADGYFGWEEHAPFEAIIVTAALDHVPPSLLQQLADGGRLVIPVGPPGAVQTLWLIQKHGDRFSRTNQGEVYFVTFVRDTS